MKMELTAQQKDAQAEFKAFADRRIFPYADQFDQEERIPTDLIQSMGQHGYLSTMLPQEFGGLGLDMISYGLLNEEIGRACSSTRSLITVQGMVEYALLRWGRGGQKEKWLPRLAAGELIGAFALTEPETGSDARKIRAEAIKTADGFVLNGRKKWITFAQIADLFLIFAQCGEGNPTAFLVEKDRPGVTVEPIRGLMGCRASMLGEIHLEDCWIPKENMLGGIGFGFGMVALSALDMGRYSVAWGSVGIGQACVDAGLAYAAEREQFGRPLRDHQLIQRMLTNMITEVKAARLLCLQAGYLHDQAHPTATAETLVAKYYASTMAARAAGDAVQIHGANGCSDQYPVARYLRDAKIMEIIEGSNEMQQMLIAKNAFNK